MYPENAVDYVVERAVRSEVLTVDGGTALRRFAAWADTLGPPAYAGSALKARVLDEVKAVAATLDVRAATGLPHGYDRQVLYEIPRRWSLAAIILRPGQETHPHDHGGWGCAVTVQGVERDRRFFHDAGGKLVLKSEREYPSGAGYTFDAVDIHQPFGADPSVVTVGIHFLVHGGEH